MSRQRSKYTPEDDRKMLEFLETELRNCNKSAWEYKGDRLWKKAQRLKITSHSFQSMRDHMKRYIMPNLEFANCGLATREYIKAKLQEGPPVGAESDESDDDITIIDDRSVASGGSMTSTPRRKRRYRPLDFNDEDFNVLNRSRSPKRSTTEKSASSSTTSTPSRTMPEVISRRSRTPSNPQPSKCTGNVTQLGQRQLLATPKIEDSDTDGSDFNDFVIISETPDPPAENEPSARFLYGPIVAESPQNESNVDPWSQEIRTNNQLVISASAGPTVEKETSPRNLQTPVAAESPLYESMVNEWSQDIKPPVNREDGPAIDKTVVSPDTSFELAPSSSPQNRPFWRRFVTEAKVEDPDALNRKMVALKKLVTAYGIEWPYLADVLEQLRKEKTQVDLITIEITFWKKGLRRKNM